MRINDLGSGLISQSQSSLSPFILHRPLTLHDAKELSLQQPNALLAAGCTDLVAQFREGLAPDEVVSLQKVPELTAISREDGLLRIGSMVTHHRGSSSSTVREFSTGFANAWKSIATVRIRFKATVGGNLMARRHRYEMPIILSALDAIMHFHDPLGERRLPVADLWNSETVHPGLLTSVSTETDSLLWFGYDRSMRPLTTVAMAIRSEGEGRIRITATCGSEYRRNFVLKHTQESTALAQLDAQSVAESLAEQLPDEAEDYSGSIGYRRHLVTVLSTRLLQVAAASTHERTTP